jgi:hypothetical protein
LRGTVDPKYHRHAPFQRHHSILKIARAAL